LSGNKIGPLQDEQRCLVEEGLLIANMLNDYFSSVFVNEDLNDIPIPNRLCDESETDFLSTINISESSVLNKLNGLKVGKSQGPDQIHGKLLFELRLQLLKPLTHLFNLSLKTGVIPQDWRDADVVPLFKKGSKRKCENYRPISLTSIVCKLLESIVKDEIVKYLDQCNLIKDSQHGFTSGKSCLTNLLDFFETITKDLDEVGSVDLIYLDFAKAFNKVPHKRLLNKVEAHGIIGNVSHWIDKWLSDRRQRVVIEGNYSGWCNISSGVP